MSSPPSDTSEPVMVSRPPSPLSPPREPGAPIGRHNSPLPPVTVIKDSPTETVTALAPSAQLNTAAGLGQPGQDQLARFTAPPVLGGAQGVVGAAHGTAPEYIAAVRRADPAPATDEHTARCEIEGDVRPPPAVEVETAIEHDEEDGRSANEQDEHDEGGKKQPKWFRKMKEGAASAASSIKEKAASVSSTHSPSRSRADSAASSTLDASGAPVGRVRSRSIGQRSAVVSFAEPASTRSSLDVPRGPTRIVTDRDGHPVPLSVGDNLGGGTPTSSTPEGVVPPPGVAAGNASTSTSVKDKILESGYDVEEKFHSLFRDIPQDEELIEDYRCALVRDILVQGKLYVSETFLSFRANILGWETSLQLPWSEIVSIEKAYTAKVFPNAIEVRTLHATHTFSSLVARDASYALIVAIWKHVHPEAGVLAKEARAEARAQRARGRATSVSTAATTDDEDDAGDTKSEISFEDETGAKKRHRFRLPRGKVSAALRSIKGRDTALDDGTAAPTGPTEAEKVKASARAAGASGEGGPTHAPTQYDGPEYKNEALDCVIPTSLWKAYQLFFRNTEFLKAFLEEKEQLREIDIGPWRAISGSAAEEDDEHGLKQRDMNYVKPLNAPVGPKQTHCNIHDENEKLDPESWIANKTTTRTPDVPSGDGFSVVTRTVFTWAEGGGTRVRVTTEVEWTKPNRFLKGVIERGAIDGQKTYHKDLEAAVRAHISANPAEYGVTKVASSADAAATPAATATTTSASAQPAVESGILASLPFAPDTTFLALLALLGFLVFTNLYTLLSLRSASSSAASARVAQPGEISAAVSRVLGEFNALHARRLEGADGAAGVVGELGELKALVSALEGTLKRTAGELLRAVETVRDVADRTEGVRGML
ncbi:hypothetical protein JCM10213v2_005866 [Rhodosporidiobolus nylandii]